MSTVVIAETDPFSRKLLEEVCETAGHTAAVVLDGNGLIESMRRSLPDLVLLDLSLPMSAETASAKAAGLDVLGAIKTSPELGVVPVIVITLADDVDGRRAGLAAGAEDYLAKPFKSFEIQQRVRNALRRAEAERKVRTEDEALDLLTRAGSASQLAVSLEYETSRAARYGHAIAVIALRISALAQVEKERGRASADALVHEVAQGVRGCIRAIDFLFRPSDDELVVVLPETAAGDAQVVIERIRERERDGSLVPLGLEPRLEIGLSSREPGAASEQDGPRLLELARGARTIDR